MAIDAIIHFGTYANVQKKFNFFIYPVFNAYIDYCTHSMYSYIKAVIIFARTHACIIFIFYISLPVGFISQTGTELLRAILLCGAILWANRRELKAQRERHCLMPPHLTTYLLRWIHGGEKTRTVYVVVNVNTINKTLILCMGHSEHCGWVVIQIICNESCFHISTWLLSNMHLFLLVKFQVICFSGGFECRKVIH